MGSYLSKEDVDDFQHSITRTSRDASKKFLFIFFIVVIVVPQLLFYALRNFGQ
jgi:hypothetical protein